MKGTWGDYHAFKVHGGVYAIEKPDYPRESEGEMMCHECGKIGSLAGESTSRYLDPCPRFKRLTHLGIEG